MWDVPCETLTRDRLLVKVPGRDDMLPADGYALWSSPG